MMINYVMVGKRIKKFRNCAGLTQEQLSEKLTISNEHLSRIETGSAHPSLPLIEKIAVVLNVREESLLFGTIEETKITDDVFKKINLLDENKKNALNEIVDIISKM